MSLCSRFFRQGAAAAGDDGGWIDWLSSPSSSFKTAATAAPAPDPAVTSLAALPGGYVLAACRRQVPPTIQLHQLTEEGTMLLREFKGHASGVTDLVVLDRKGRFLSAGMDKTVRLWDSRFHCEEEEGDDARGPRTHLATFKCFKRWIHSIEVIDEGEFVRPTDGIDRAMLKAMMKKAALEGVAAVQQAAALREIIKCSGSFATASINDHNVSVWTMDVTEKSEGGASTGRDANLATLSLAHMLEHDHVITALATARTSRGTRIFAGDDHGIVHLWERSAGGFLASLGGGGGAWTKLREFTPWERALNTLDELEEQAVVGLCVLDEEAFVAAAKTGGIRVWDRIETGKKFEVQKKKRARGVRFTNGTVTGIQKLPPIRDPRTGEDCLAFSVASTDGSMVSIAVQPRGSSGFYQSGLVMFHEHGRPRSEDDKTDTVAAIESIAVYEVDDSSLPVLIVGDGQGGISTVLPEWSKEDLKPLMKT